VPVLSFRGEGHRVGLTQAGWVALFVAMIGRRISTAKGRVLGATGGSLGPPVSSAIASSNHGKKSHGRPRMAGRSGSWRLLSESYPPALDHFQSMARATPRRSCTNWVDSSSRSLNFAAAGNLCPCQLGRTGRSPRHEAVLGATGEALVASTNVLYSIGSGVEFF